MALTLTKALPSLVRSTHSARASVPHGIRGLTRCRAERRASPAGRPEEEQSDLLLQACPVPRDQQPMMEFKALQDAFLFDWPLRTFPEFCLRLGGVFLGFFFLMGLPVSVLTFSVQTELVQVLAASSIGSGFITLLLVLRLYIGYSHVSSRLLSATVEYEETGWYDGQVWVKTPQMLMRDRLLGTYQVKPVLENLKRTLLGLSGVMAAATVLLATGPTPKAYSDELPSYPSSPSLGLSLTASQQDSYDSRVAAYEPWGVEDEVEEGDELMAGRPTLLDHMKQ